MPHYREEGSEESPRAAGGQHEGRPAVGGAPAANLSRDGLCQQGRESRECSRGGGAGLRVRTVGWAPGEAAG